MPAPTSPPVNPNPTSMIVDGTGFDASGYWVSICRSCHTVEGTGFHNGFWVCDNCQSEESRTDDDSAETRNTRRIFPKVKPVIHHVATHERRPVIRNVEPTGVQAAVNEIMHRDHDSNRHDHADSGIRKNRWQQPAKPARDAKAKRYQTKGKAKPHRKSARGGKRH